MSIRINPITDKAIDPEEIQQFPVGRLFGALVTTILVVSFVLLFF